jgi:signal transduction histidine kinase
MQGRQSKKMIAKKVFQTFRRIQWKLTFSYSAVTVGSLFIVVIVLGYLAFSRAYVPIEIISQDLTPETWIQIITENNAPLARRLLSQDPVDTGLIGTLLQSGNFTVTDIEIFQIGDFRVRISTSARGSTLILDQDGVLLGISNPDLLAGAAVGQPLDPGILPSLEETLNAALRGETDPGQLFVTLQPHESFYFAVPVRDENHQEVLGAVLVYMQHLPTTNDIPETLLLLLGRSVLILLLAAGLVGTLFGALTARGIVARLERVSQVTGAWSQGDFSEFIKDTIGDEISQLAVRLNNMAEQLKQFLKRSQEIAVSEERNRLARDLHDSAKQEALAASFHIGTALTLFERDPGSARSHLVEADNLVNTVRKELTDLIHELRPPLVEGARFDETLNEYIIEWAQQTGIEASLNVHGYFELPLEIKQAIYRIMQEALANVTRHSSAKRVDATIRFGERTVEFCLCDDGVGFDTQRQYDGIGLRSMRERVETLNGDFHIESRTGQGTNICITIPTG